MSGHTARPTQEDDLHIVQPGPSPAAGRGPKRTRSRSAALTRAWKSATTVNPVEVAAYRPVPDDMKIGLALLGGAQGLADLAEQTQLPRHRIDRVLADPVRMAWVSTQVYSHFQQRAALVDASLYTRAMAGDVAAIKLFYDRMALFTTGQKVSVEISGGVNVRALSDDDLRRLVAEGAKKLPPPPPLLESRPIDVDFEPAPAPARDTPLPVKSFYITPQEKNLEGRGGGSPEGTPAPADTGVIGV